MNKQHAHGKLVHINAGVAKAKNGGGGGGVEPPKKK